MKILLFLLFNFFLFSSTMTIRDGVSLRRIYNAEVKIGDSTYYSDKYGRVNFNTRSDSIFINAIGYEKTTIDFEEAKKLKFLIYLNQTGVELDEIVISATRWKQERKNVPIKISSIQKSEIELRNPQTSADLLELSGEVFVQKSQMGGGSPMIRGFSTNRLLLSVDGVRMNNAIFRSGNVQNVISIDPFAVENTEVICGPGSVIYGSDAIGGVMSFYTKSPKFSRDSAVSFSGDADIRSSSANFEKTAHFDFNLGFNKWAFVGGVSYTDFDDLRMGSNGPDEYLRNEYVNSNDQIAQNEDPEIQKFTGYSQINYLGKASFKPNNDYQFDASLMYSETSDYPRYDRLIQYSGDQLRNSEWYYGPQKWLFAKLNYRYTGESFFHDALNVFVAYQNFQESRNDRRFGRSSLRNQDENLDAISINADAEVEIGTKGELFYGAEYVINTLRSVSKRTNINTGEITPIAPRYPNCSDWRSIAAYLNYRHQINDKLNLTAGARYSYISSNSEFDTDFFDFENTEANLRNSAVNGSIGAAYRPNKTTHFSVNAASGFRAPNIDDIGKIFESGNGQVVIPNTDLNPEYAYSFEIDAAKMLFEILKIDIAGFYTILNNVMVNRPFILNGQESIVFDGEMMDVRAIQNSASGYVYGIQGDVELKLPYNLSISSKLSYQKGAAENDAGVEDPLRHVAPLFGSTSLSYQKNKLTLQINSDYNGEVSNSNMNFGESEKTHIYATNENGKPYSPSWYTFNFFSSYRFSENLYMTFAVENITDQRYRPYSSGLVAPGINFIGALKISF